ncbi:hypothetical protein QQ056_16235 [Oscillatoria laete-virens NRMC-F 0139]|nr:hypothetical protein [Oscillatoria laete-virens]MDL5055086.1 hypothetical protein [Oscillatoria laete-virens NRMC-F 0139]
MDKLKAQYEKHIVIGLFVIVTLIPIVATVGLFFSIVLLQNNILDWLE